MMTSVFLFGWRKKTSDNKIGISISILSSKLKNIKNLSHNSILLSLKCNVSRVILVSIEAKIFNILPKIIEIKIIIMKLKLPIFLLWLISKVKMSLLSMAKNMIKSKFKNYMLKIKTWISSSKNTTGHKKILSSK